MKPGQGQSLEEVIRESIKGSDPFFLKALIICNGNFQLLPESYWTEMKTRCPHEYQADRPKPLGQNSNWGSTKSPNLNNVYKRGYRMPLKEWEAIVEKLRSNSMTTDGIDCSRLIPFLSNFTKNARDSCYQSKDILPLEYIGKTKNIIHRNRDWLKCVKKENGFHGMLEYFIKYIGYPPDHVHVVGCFNNDPQSLNAEAFVARLCEGITDGAPRYFSTKDGTAFNVAPCGHYGFVGLNTEAIKDALKQWKLGKINLKMSTHRTWQEFADKQRAASEAWKRGIRNPTKYPVHKSWMNTDDRHGEKHTITYTKKFDKQVQDWLPQRHLNWGAISLNTRDWVSTMRRRNSEQDAAKPLTDAEKQKLSKLNFPFHPKVDQWNSNYTRLLEFQREHGVKSIPSSSKKGKKYDLYVWCNKQKLKARNNKLSEAQLFKVQSVLDW